MALTWCEGCDDGTTGYGYTGGVSGVLAGRWGGSCFQMYNQSSFITPTLVTTNPIIIGFALNYSAGFDVDAINFRGDNGTVIHVVLRHGADGHIELRHGGSGAVLGSSVAGVFPENVWRYLELKLTISDTVGQVTAKIDGTTVINTASTLDTANGGTNKWIDRIEYKWPNAGGSFTFDDVYYADTSGSYNNDFLGDIVVETIRPVTPDLTAQWLGSDGNSTDNYALINESGTVNKTNNVTSNTVGQRDVYTLGDLTRSSATIYGVMAVSIADRVDTIPRSVAAVLRQSDGTLLYGPTTALNLGTDIVVQAIKERKNDSSEWLVADVAGLGVGMEVMS